MSTQKYVDQKHKLILIFDERAVNNSVAEPYNKATITLLGCLVEMLETLSAY